MAESIDLNFNLSGGKESNNNDLITSINHLTNKLSTFESTIGKLVKNSNTYTKAGSAESRTQILQERTKLQTATAQVSAERTKQRKAEQSIVQERAKEKMYVRQNTDARSSLIQKQLNLTNAKTKQLVTQQPILQTRADASFTNARSKLMREELITGLKKQSDTAFEKGDTKTGKQLLDAVTGAVTKGTREGVNKSNISKIGGFGGALYGAKLVSNQLIANYGYGTQIGSAAMSNPLTNNYDYGSPAARILQSSAQQKYSTIGTASTIGGGIIGGVLGAFGGPAGSLAGAGIGSSVGNIISSVYGAASNSKASLQSEAIGSYINQRMTNEALVGSNAASANLLTSTTGLKGNKFAIGKGDQSSELDPTMPLAREISKGAAIYNRNFKEMDTLTKYAVAAQVPMSQLPKLGANAALLNLSKNEIANIANLSTNSGISFNDIAERTLMFQQGGFSKDSAMDAASKSFQNVSGFQSQQNSFYQGGYMSREMRDIYGDIFGYNVEAIENSNHPKHKEAMAKLSKDQEAMSRAPHGIAGIGNSLTRFGLDISGFPQNTYNPNNPTGKFMNAGNSKANMTPNSEQTGFLDLAHQTSLDAFSGTIDVNAVSKSMGMFVQNLTGSTVSLTNFDDAMTTATNSIKEFTSNFSATKGPGVVASGESAVEAMKNLYRTVHRTGSTGTKLTSSGGH